MRICPKCGYVDPIWWRPAAYHPEFSYTHLSSIELLDSELVELLRDKKPGEIVQRGPYLYWKSTRSETVRRVWTEDYRLVGKKGSWMEGVDHSFQEKLDGYL